MLKLLLAGSEPARTVALERRLHAIADAAISCVPDDCALADAVGAALPDAIVVDLARPDRDRLGELCRAIADRPLAAIVFVDRDDPGFMEAAIAAGVSSYNVAERDFPDIEPIVGAALAFFRRQQQVAAALHQAQAALTEREIINRAKALLMKARNIGEPQAYHWMRRRAMNENKRIGDIAAAILAAGGESEPAP